MRKGSWILMTLILLLVGGRSEGVEVSMQDFTKKVLAEWESVCQEVKAVRMEMAREHYSTRGGKTLRMTSKHVIRYVANCDGWSWGYEAEEYDANNTIQEKGLELSIKNDSYKAVMVKARKSDALVLRDFRTTKHSQGEEAKEDFRKQACPWLVVGNVWVPGWVAKKGFIIRRAAPIQEGRTPGLLRIDFAYHPEHENAKRQEKEDWIDSGFFDIDPDMRCRVMKYRYSIKMERVGEWIEHGELIYGNPDGNLPVVKQKITEIPQQPIPNQGMWSSKDNETFQMDYHPVVTKEEFRLPHYNIPEPGRKVQKPNRTPWILLAAAGGVFALLTLLYRKRGSGADEQLKKTNADPTKQSP